MIMLLCTAKEAYLEQTTLLMCRSIFLSVFVSYANILSKLVLIVACIWMGHAPFHSKEFVLPGSLEGQLRCFSAALCWYSLLRKAFTMSFQTCSTCISNRHILPTFNQSLTAYNLDFWYKDCFLAAKALLTRVWKDKHMYIHTHTLFRKQTGVHLV